MVILGHCSGCLGTNIFTPLGGIGVAIFLMLSGFGLSESFKRKGLDGFISGKLFRVWLPFALFILAVHLLHEQHDFKNIALEILSIRPRSYWYVHYLLRCYFVFWIAYRFAYKYRWTILVLFSVYTFFLTGSVPAFSSGSLTAQQCLSFPLGILLSEKRSVLDRLTRKKAFGIGLVLATFGIACLAVKQLPVVREYIDTYIYYAVETGIKLPLGLAAVLFYWLLPVRWMTNWFTVFCGLLSYELYLVHMQLFDLVQSSVSASMMIIISLFMAYSMSVASKKIKNGVIGLF